MLVEILSSGSPPPIMGGSPPKYYVNFRLIHGVLSCGLTEREYTSFCQAANIGSEGKKTSNTVLEKAQLLDSREEGLQSVDVGCSRTSEE